MWKICPEEDGGLFVGVLGSVDVEVICAHGERNGKRE